MTIRELMARAHETSNSKGWWPRIDESDIPEKLCLMHEEISEALGCYRNGEPAIWIRDDYGKPEGLAVEIADVIIRALDFCKAYDLPIEDALDIKLEFNESRPHRHGGKKC